MNLEQYLSKDVERDQRSVKRLRKMSELVLESFAAACSPSGDWPYQVVAEETPIVPEEYSRSTAAMILHAISVTVGRIPHGELVPAVRTWKPVALTEKLKPVLNVATQRFFDALAGSEPVGSEATDRVPTERSPEQSPFNHSDTWGDDDPLTLTWVAELLNQENVPVVVSDRLRRVARKRLDAVLMNPSQLVLKFDTDSGTQVVPHMFPALRMLKLDAAIGGSAAGGGTGPLASWFRDGLHTQLSLSVIRDGGFDPASLVFALEGLVMLDRERVEMAVIQRVVDVLRATPVPYWRPVKPLTVTPRGLVLLPQSVEVANSFLRICDMVDTNSVDSLFGQSLEMLRGYTDWLESRALKASYPREGSSCCFEGWQSEHTFATSTVHLWATSQVLLYLQHYGAMLEQHVARTLRADAGLAYTAIADLDTDPDPEKPWSWDGDKGVLAQEPLLGLDEKSKDRIYAAIDKRFVQTRASTRPDKGAGYSMLLYGPPGTGKTMLARDIARRLKFDFISVSPSDFIRTGESGVEARAKRIFEVLGAQLDVVVLFDEIDRLLLDRSSDEYGSQSDMFQFMTPSMLTKIHDLREAKRSLFIIATNYAERIDGAMKRPGRIDEQFLLLPPDLLQRRRIVEKLIEQTTFRAQAIVPLADRTPLYVFTELKGVVEILLADKDVAPTRGENAGTAVPDAPIDAKVLDDKIGEALRQFPPGISIAGYRNRFVTKAGELREISDCPWQEFVFLLYLLSESHETVGDGWCHEVVSAVSQAKSSYVAGDILAGAHHALVGG